MPIVQYVNKVEDVRKTATMPTPKRNSEMLYWFKAARKVIPEIPNPGVDGWIIEHQDANTDWIRYDLRSPIHGKANVVIMRQQAKFGS